MAERIVYQQDGYLAEFTEKGSARIVNTKDNTVVAETHFCSGNDKKYLRQYLRTYLALRITE